MQQQISTKDFPFYKMVICFYAALLGSIIINSQYFIQSIWLFPVSDHEISIKRLF